MRSQEADQETFHNGDSLPYNVYKPRSNDQDSGSFNEIDEDMLTGEEKF
jgi:hypothetical protein